MFNVRSARALALVALFLVGFCVLIQPGSTLQLVIGFVFSLYIVLLLTSIAGPFQCRGHDMFCLYCNFALVMFLFFGLVLKMGVLLDEKLDLLSDEIQGSYRGTRPSHVRLRGGLSSRGKAPHLLHQGAHAYAGAVGRIPFQVGADADLVGRSHTCTCALAPSECRFSFPMAVSASRRRLRKTPFMLPTNPRGHTHTTTIVARLAAAAASDSSEPMESGSGSISTASPRSPVSVLARDLGPFAGNELLDIGGRECKVAVGGVCAGGGAGSGPRERRSSWEGAGRGAAAVQSVGWVRRQCGAGGRHRYDGQRAAGRTGSGQSGGQRGGRRGGARWGGAHVSQVGAGGFSAVQLVLKWHRLGTPTPSALYILW